MYQPRKSESIHKSKLWDWHNLWRIPGSGFFLLIWGSNGHYPDLWFINPVAGQGGGWAEGYLREMCQVFIYISNKQSAYLHKIYIM